MTESEWVTCPDPEAMLHHRGKVAERKWILLVCACCRRIWDLIEDERTRGWVEVHERFANGRASEDERERAEEESLRAYDEAYPGHAAPDTKAFAAGSAGLSRPATLPSVCGCLDLSRKARAYAQAVLAPNARYDEVFAETVANQAHAQADLVREVFPNPFRPIVIRSKWQMATVTSLAQAAYEERESTTGQLDTVRLAVLADALEEAGCSDETILARLRSPGPHVRGCWALDLILGKS